MDETDAEGEMDGLCVTDCTRCPALVDSRSRIVNGTGPEDADVLFVGRSGSVLDDHLRAVGLEREAVRITNCVRCRPPENRDPNKDELENCRGWLEREIDLVDPEVIVTLGKVPTEHLLGRSVAVTKEAGTVEEVRLDGTPRRLLICLHPAATLYDRSQEETLEAALETAAALAGVDSGGDNQSRLDGF